MKESEVAQLCPTRCDPMDCSLPGSSIHGIFQARILEWVAISKTNQIRGIPLIAKQEKPGNLVKTPESPPIPPVTSAGVSLSPMLFARHLRHSSLVMPTGGLRNSAEVVYHLGEGNGTPLLYS